VAAIPSATTIRVAESLTGDFLTANSASVQALKPNTIASHQHLIRGGEFVRHLDEEEVRRLYPAYHGHGLSSMIASVLDLNRVNGVTYAVGSGVEVMSTVDNGATWGCDLDLSELSELRPGTAGVTGVFTDSENLLLPTSNGQIVYKSPLDNAQLTVLELPL